MAMSMAKTGCTVKNAPNPLGASSKISGCGRFRCADRGFRFSTSLEQILSQFVHVFGHMKEHVLDRCFFRFERLLAVHDGLQADSGVGRPVGSGEKNSDLVVDIAGAVVFAERRVTVGRQ